MTPELRISPAGEVQIDTSFFDQIMDPVGRDFANYVIEQKRASYSELLTEPDVHSVDDSGSIETEFLAAWEDEMGATLSDFRLVVDEIENMTMEASQAWLTIPRDELISRLSNKTKAAGKVVEALENISRKEWRKVPKGFVDADRQPWRYRRRLSVARLPLLRLGSSASSAMVIAPGIRADAQGFDPPCKRRSPGRSFYMQSSDQPCIWPFGFVRNGSGSFKERSPCENILR